MTEDLKKYQIEQLHTITGEIKTILSTHVDDDHEVQMETNSSLMETNSSLRVLLVQVASIQDELKKLSAKTSTEIERLSAKTSTTWDYVQKALGALALIGFLLMAAKYLGGS